MYDLSWPVLRVQFLLHPVECNAKFAYLIVTFPFLFSDTKFDLTQLREARACLLVVLKYHLVKISPVKIMVWQ